MKGILELLACPECKGELEELKCKQCGKQYETTEGIPDFT